MFNGPCVQVRAGYSKDGRLVRNNFALIKAFIGTWRAAVPLAPRDLLFHLSAMPETSREGGEGGRDPGSAERAREEGAEGGAGTVERAQRERGPGGPTAKLVSREPAAIAAALRQRAFGMKLLAAGED